MWTLSRRKRVQFLVVEMRIFILMSAEMALCYQLLRDSHARLFVGALPLKLKISAKSKNLKLQLLMHVADRETF